VILTVLASGLIAGCSAKATHDIDGPRSPNLLFSNDRSALVATQIGRSEWPATLGNVESTQETVFLEYYYDYQGHESLERNNPQRFFRSYRIGMQAR
jgi:hypothetical protein